MQWQATHPIGLEKKFCYCYTIENVKYLLDNYDFDEDKLEQTTFFLVEHGLRLIYQQSFKTRTSFPDKYVGFKRCEWK